MTLNDLIERLQEIADDLGEEADEVEVRLAVQPRWAFEHTIAGIALSSDLRRGDDEEEAGEESTPIVYLAEGEQIGYAPPGIWEAAR